MRQPGAPRAHRVPVAADAGVVGGERYDYADAFEIRAPELQGRSAEDLARLIVQEALPPVLWMIRVAHRHLLRFRLGPYLSPDHILGWKIVRRDLDTLVIEADSPLLRSIIVGRKTEQTCTVVTTYVFYKRPTIGRILLLIAGPIHRRIAPHLLERASASLIGSSMPSDARATLPKPARDTKTS